jgi:hypothetical protein
MHSVRVSDFLTPGLSSGAKASLSEELVDVRGQPETSDAGLDAGRVGLQDSVDWNDGEWMPRPVPHLSPVTVSSPVVQRSAETSGASPLIGPNQIAAPDPAYPPSPSLEPSSHSGSFDLATWQKTGVPKTSPADQSSANFDLVSSNPLFARGMNAAPAIFDHYIYIGNRTDGSAMHPHPGVLVVDVADPSQPRIVSEIGAPFEGNANETSRELRVWPDASLLMIMNFTCDRGLHACQGGSVRPTIKFYDLSGDYAAHPELISTYSPVQTPHEMFLWVDPLRKGRALLYFSAPTTSLTQPNLVVTDISRAREGIFTQVATGNWNDQFDPDFRRAYDVRLHSMSVSPDGTRTYLAYLGGGFLIVDSSDVAQDLPNPQLRLLTPAGDNPHWGNPGAHSAVKVFGRPLVLMTDEVYGTLLGREHGCPWGWVRLIDTTDEANPQVVGEYKLVQNTQAYCQSLEGQDPNNTRWTSYSSHNPTVLRNLALVTWHSGGFQAFSVSDPTRPLQTGFFLPDPLEKVATEDPALSLGLNKVVMWSYPIIKDGLIYVVDIRNGLYVLRYTGPGAEEVAAVTFLEGNSNLGDAQQLDVG